ncbi:gamma-glutamyl-gamma-aminobutyrate hydrolase family protein [Chitinophaga pendula]|uniref:type 1 glutamine amidotransferase n=1 Tax=Chitinophaga TaxID=79328 RepID=UPI000BAF0305|nr:MULTISPECIES: gamma-glutamyl-gamma-aminobutyrate hydrolase family protein [Chitinophaga]ASZ14381.1 amidotransferase [Chitinophaga sp. MD30]UCJ07967.1 gamma-glutamyl-gamma-aminobutyrate hydrolase family protein [Chitinophaga pendula]
MTIHYFQHVPFEDPGCIIDWATQKQYQLKATHWYDQPTVPDISGIDLLIIMGGPMSVHDQAKYPWLSIEKELIAATIRAGKPALGICLGAQLIADVLGAAVRPHTHKEIGWFPVSFSTIGLPTLKQVFPEAQNVFHWHGDTFAIPDKAVLFASTPICSNQAFIYQDRVVGLQFHLEVTSITLEKMISHGLDDLTPAPYIQYASEMLEQQALIPACNATMFRLLDQLAALAQPA